MALDRAKRHLEKYGLADKIMLFDVSSATVELAAQAAGTAPERIAKTMSFWVEDKPVLVVIAGDARVDNHKFKERFHTKAVMIKFEDVEPAIGHAVGGVCPFGVNDDVTVYLDESLKRFETVFPAAGTNNSAIELTIPELEKASCFKEWIDISKLPTEQA